MVEDKGTAEFNMGVSYLNRLNALFYIADESAMALDINTWLHALMCLFRELSTEMTERFITEMEADFANINAILQKYNQGYSRGRNEVSPELYNALHKAEIKLRTILKKSGLQMKMKQAAEFALEDT